jgi:hypothetical protein
MTKGTCPNESHNVLPVNLIMKKMLNESPNLTNFIYDFVKNKYGTTKECPTWMRDGCYHGSLKITQEQSREDIINFATIGDLTGYGKYGEVSCYYFPVSLNLYDDNPPSGGEIVIELKDKRPQIVGKPERILIFIPVEDGTDNKKSKEWFSEISKNMGTDTSVSSERLSLNDIIPKASFWVYNDIRLHSDCAASNEKTHGIFFQIDDAIGIDPNVRETFIVKVDTLTKNSYTCVPAGATTDATEPAGATTDTTDKPKPAGHAECDYGFTPEVKIWPWRPMKLTSDETAISDAKDGDIVMDKEKMAVRKCCIFKNEIGTKQGPGIHNQVGDPFSLTCEPIIDADDDTPIDSIDRLEWVKNIYKSAPPEMKNMFMALIFICILIIVLMSVHVIIFKNIGLFITQNEISERANK